MKNQTVLFNQVYIYNNPPIYWTFSRNSTLLNFSFIYNGKKSLINIGIEPPKNVVLITWSASIYEWNETKEYLNINVLLVQLLVANSQYFQP